MKMKSLFKDSSVLILTLVLLLCGCGYTAPASAAVEYAVTSPWIASIADFIGGTNVKVRCIGNWNDTGRLHSISRPRAGEIVIALDTDEAAALNINQRQALRLLYDNLSLPAEQRYTVFFDPAMLPFIAQSVMKILSEADNPRYSFYQRRLAEFQSRIDSTVEIGRYMLVDVKLLDLTGAQGVWVRSAMPGAVRPPADVWKSWIDGNSAALSAALAEANSRGWLILLDSWTPAGIRAAATAYGNRLTLPPPRIGQDSFTFLHDIFITIATRAKSQKPQPRTEPK